MPLADPPALCDDGEAGGGGGVVRESGQNVRDTGSEVRQPWVLSFHSTTCQHWANHPTSLGVFPHLKNGDNRRMSQVRWSGNRNEMIPAKHGASNERPTDSAPVGIEVA